MRSFRLALMCAGAGLAFPGIVYAQENVGAKEAQADSNVIVVTAQKRAQSLQEVAASVVAFDTDTIEERNLNSIENLALASPGVNYQETNGTSQLSIRGVGLLVNTGVAEPNVATHIDGIFQPRASATTLQFLDLERVEVLRGPQGTLYGRNATGGSINFISAAPKNTFEFAATAGIGSYDARKLSGYVTGPLVGDAVMVRLSAVYDRDDGYYENIFTGDSVLGSESWGMRGAVRIVPTDDITIDLSVYHQEEDTVGPIQTTLGASNPIVDQLVLFGILPPGFVTVTNEPFKTAGETAPLNRTETTGLVGKLEFELTDDLMFRSLTGYTKHKIKDQVFDGDGTSLGIVNIGNPTNPRFSDSEAISQEFNLSGQSLGDRLNWLLGFYYFQEDHTASIPAVFPSPIIQAVLGAGFDPVFGPGTLFLGLDQVLVEDTESFAAFADLTFSVTDTLRVGVGVRRTEDTKDFRQTFLTNLVAPGLGPVSLPSCVDLRTKVDFKDTNWRLRGEFDATDDALVYGQWQNAFKDGGVNISGCGDTFPREKIDAFEAGARTSWLGGDLTLNFAAFYYDYTDLQILAFRNATDAFVDSVPRSTIKGAEIEAVLRPAAGLQFDLGVSLLDSKIYEFVSFDQANPLAGLQDLAGNDLPNTPSYTLALGAEYEWNLDFGKIRLRGEMFHSDGYNFRPFGNIEDRQNGYTLLNVYAGFTDPTEKFSVRGFIKNATDEEYQAFLLFAPTTGRAGSYAAPMTLGIETGVRF